MDALRDSLLRRIKTLSDTVWEHRVNDALVTDWLENFVGKTADVEEERIAALHLLSNYLYFGNRHVRELLKSIYRDLYKYPIVESIRRRSGDTLDSAFLTAEFERTRAATKFLGVGNPSDSGAHLLYYFRQENSLPRSLFADGTHVFDRNSHGQMMIRDAAIARYIFIDDFCGTGKQGIDFCGRTVDAIRTLDPSVHTAYYSLVGTAEGLAHLRKHTRFDDVRTVYELDTTFRCFDPSSRYFVGAPPEVTLAKSESLCRTYGETLVPPEHSLGYDNCQLLIGFSHNTPDNTLPIIWHNEPTGPGWVPVFKRYPKLTLVTT